MSLYGIKVEHRWGGKTRWDNANSNPMEDLRRMIKRVMRPRTRLSMLGEQRGLLYLELKLQRDFGLADAYDFTALRIARIEQQIRREEWRHGRRKRKASKRRAAAR